MKATLPLLATLLALPAYAQDTRQLDAHEHGVGVLNIAAEGSTLLMELRAPGADIVGFEYSPETDADTAAVDSALATLGQPLSLFAIPEGAGCSVTDAAVALEVEDEGDHAEHDHGAEKDHDDHGHDEHAEEKGHDDHGHDEHAHDDHAHDDHAGEAKATHTEFHATYTLTCADPAAITTVAFPYFDLFENAQEVEVQVVTGAGAQAFEVERDAPTVDLTGLF